MRTERSVDLAGSSAAGPRDPGIRSLVSARPEAERAADDTCALALAALESRERLEGALAGRRSAAPRAAAARMPASPAGAFLRSIAVEGFRGIGPARTLELPPGPGLTLVVGRNGSGK